MSWNAGHLEEALDEAAATWVVRLQSDSLGEDEAVAFDAWLTASARNARAYDEALEAWLSVDAHALKIREALTTPAVRRPPFGRRAVFGIGLAAAAGLAVAVLAPILMSDPVQTFATGKGEHRTVRLADGSKIDLDGGTRLSVKLGRGERRVDLAQGEAIFDVAADSARPFYVAAGDRTVRVVGTQFDVRRLDGSVSVTVARGVVEVRPTGPAPGRAFRLHPGQRLDHRDGAPETRVVAAQPDDIFAWRSGRLVYRDQPLKEVVADLNQNFARPIVLEDKAMGDTKVSAVLVLDDQGAVIRRLALLVPITAITSDQGVLLRRDGTSKR
jgi:transmembrane sensor